MGIAPQAVAASYQPRCTETVLLVDDDPVQRMLVQGLLREDGYTILEASDGPEALHISELYPGPIHLLVTDVVMPRMMSGPELAGRLSALRPGLRVIYSSAYTDDTMMFREAFRPNVAFLPKPFMPAVLRQTVRELLDTPAGQAAAQARRG